MIRILTDSASDILPAEAEQLGVTVIPLNVTLEDGTVLRDGVDMTPTVYYGVMARCHKLPTTSQPSPEQFERLYLDAAAAGDEVLGIFLSDALSGTGQCARLAADLANVDNVVFVNTENVCLGQSLLVRLAVQLRDAGKTITQIAADLEKAKQHLHLVAAVDDLKYLRKGGRLSAAAAVAGGMLGIKPILAVIEGKVALAGKARGLPGVYVALFKKIDEMGGIHPGYTPLLGYTVNHRELQPLLTYLQDNLHLDAPLVRQIGCVIGTHAGLQVGGDGATHAAIEDVSIMRSFPNMTVVQPADAVAARALAHAAVDFTGPLYVRLHRNPVADLYDPATYKFEWGKANTVVDNGSDMTMIVSGILLKKALDAAAILKEQGIGVRVLDMATIKPLDKEAVLKAAGETGAIMTIEDHSIFGGLGSAVAEVVVGNCPVPMEIVGIQDRFGESGDPELIYKDHGMDVDSIVAKAKALVARKG